MAKKLSPSRLFYDGRHALFNFEVLEIGQIGLTPRPQFKNIVNRRICASLLEEKLSILRFIRNF